MIMASQSSEMDALKDIPGYKAILKSVLKSQIQLLIEQLSDQTGEESIILTASVNDGTLSHLGSITGKGFLEGRDEIKSQFLGYCLKTHHKKKTQETRSPYQRSNVGSTRPSMQPSFAKRPRVSQGDNASQSFRPLSDSSLHRQDSDSNLSGVDTSDPGQNQGFQGVVKQESSGENQDYNLGDPVSFPESINRSHTQTSADQSGLDQDQGVDRSADESNDSASANIKIEPITEGEMELEITGVEPGNTSVADDNWGQGQGTYSTAGGDSMNQSADQADYKTQPHASGAAQIEASSSSTQDTENAGMDMAQAEALFWQTTDNQTGDAQTAVMTPVMTPATTPAPAQTEDDPIKKRTCSICFKVFKYPKDVKRHELIHTGERPFKCKRCGKGFTQKCHLLSHMINMHWRDGQIHEEEM